MFRGIEQNGGGKNDSSRKVNEKENKENVICCEDGDVKCFFIEMETHFERK